MRVVDNRPVFFVLSIASFYVSSFSIAFMPIASFDDESRQAFTFMLAALFWFFLLTGIFLTFRVKKQRRWDRKYMPPKGGLPRFLRFFSNRPAVIFDALFLLGAALLIFESFTFLIPEWLLWEILFVTVFSLEMHFVFNGRNYHWLSNSLRQERQRARE